MKKHVTVLTAIALLAAAAAGATGGAAPVQVQLSVDGDKYRFYQERIGFPAVISGGEPAKYRNASYQEFARWEVSENGTEQVRAILSQRLGSLDGITTGSTADTIEITYVMNESADRAYSFQDLVAATPAAVEGTVTYPTRTVQVSVPVTVRKVSAASRDYDLADKATADSGFGSGGGQRYNASFRVVDTVTGSHTGNRIANVTKEGNTIRFNGYVETATPCVSLVPSYEQDGNTLTVNVTTESGSGFCTQVLAMKQYHFELQSASTVDLKVVHGGETVRTVSLGSARSGETTESQSGGSLLAGIVQFFASLFG